MTRRGLISAFVLLVQLIGLSHVWFAHHEVTSTGTLIDAVELTADEHGGTEEAHMCAGEVAPFAGELEACAVVATWTTPVLVPVRTPLQLAALPSPRRLGALETRGVDPLDALIRAPKNSPPPAAS